MLLERVHAPSGPVAVVGIGINVDQQREELPVPTATSLALAGAAVERADLFAAVLGSLAEQLGRLAADPEAMLADYRAACSTLGAEVSVALPAGEDLGGPRHRRGRRRPAGGRRDRGRSRGRGPRPSRREPAGRPGDGPGDGTGDSRPASG